MQTEINGSTPELSVVIGTTRPWPAARDALDSVFAQALHAGAEVILVVRETSGAPQQGSHPGLRVVEGRGESVYQLRARGIESATGAIVALTEDHCIVADDWCRRILDAHREFSDADVIGGAVLNGSCTPVGWASFMSSNGDSLPPLECRPRASVAGAANVSYKRRALAGLDAGNIGEGLGRIALQERGGLLVNDDRIRVWHFNSRPLGAMCALHFHSGRAISAHLRSALGGGRSIARLGKVLLLPLRMLLAPPRVAMRAIRRDKGYWKPMLLCQPALAAVFAAQYLGELVGHFAGPGESPHRLV